MTANTNNRSSLSPRYRVIPMFTMVSSRKSRHEADDASSMILHDGVTPHLAAELEGYFSAKLGDLQTKGGQVDRNVRVEVVPAMAPAQSLIDMLPKSVGERFLEIASNLLPGRDAEGAISDIKSIAIHLGYAPSCGQSWETTVSIVPFFLHISPQGMDEINRQTSLVNSQGMYTLDGDLAKKLGDLLPRADERGHVVHIIAEWQQIQASQKFLKEYMTAHFANQIVQSGKSAVIAAGAGRNILVRNGIAHLPFLTIDAFASEVTALDDLSVMYRDWLNEHYAIIRCLALFKVPFQPVDSIELVRAENNDPAAFGSLRKVNDVVAVDQWDIDETEDEYDPAHAVLCLQGSDDGACVASLAIYDGNGSRLRHMDFYQVGENGADKAKKEAKAFALKEGVKMGLMGDGVWRLDPEEAFFYSPEVMPGMQKMGASINISELH